MRSPRFGRRHHEPWFGDLYFKGLRTPVLADPSSTANEKSQWEEVLQGVKLGWFWE